MLHFPFTQQEPNKKPPTPHQVRRLPLESLFGGFHRTSTADLSFPRSRHRSFSKLGCQTLTSRSLCLNDASKSEGDSKQVFVSYRPRGNVDIHARTARPGESMKYMAKIT